MIPWLIGGAVAAVGAYILAGLSETEEERLAREDKETQERLAREAKETQERLAREAKETQERLAREVLEIKYNSVKALLISLEEEVDGDTQLKQIDPYDYKRIDNFELIISIRTNIFKKREEMEELGKLYSTKILNDYRYKWHSLISRYSYLLESVNSIESEIGEIKLFLEVGIREIDNMSGNEFERILSKYFSKLGYQSIVTQQTQDFGADLILNKNGEKYVVQAKRSANTVGVRAIQEVTAARGYYQATRAIVVTNNFFTENAKELAYRNKVEAWDRNSLINFIKEAKNKYLWKYS